MDKTLKELMNGIEHECVRGNEDVPICDVVSDSRKVIEGCVYVCIVGANFDGHSVAIDMVKSGISAIVISKDVDIPIEYDVCIIKVKDTRYAIAYLSANYYSNPASKLITIGITGTKGKTTTTYLIKSLLEHAGYKVGLVGTIETIIANRHIPAVHTTPEAYVLQGYMRDMVSEGIDIMVMEVSSQGLMLHRSEGFIFDYGIYTNLSPDHIGPNEHRDFAHYIECKNKLFRQCKIGIVNSDDEYCSDVTQGHTCEIYTYGIESEADYKAYNMQAVNINEGLGMEFDVSGMLDMHCKVSSPGRFSIYNSLCAIALCNNFNLDSNVINLALSNVKVKGRIEAVKVSNEFSLIIDYAHNAMALSSLLTTLREYNPQRLVTLFGCGGNRASSRRYEMGEVSGTLSDLTIITSDNPRYEEPIDIIKDIEVGINRTGGDYVIIVDRVEAIRYAIRNGRKGDIIVLAGKGHEDYQEIRGIKYPMDERVIIAKILGEE